MKISKPNLVALVILIITLQVIGRVTAFVAQSFSPHSSLLDQYLSKRFVTLKTKLFQQYNIEKMAYGKSKGYYIIDQWEVPEEGLSLDPQLVEEQKKRGIIELPNQVTLPIALMTLDPEQFPTRSSAKKALRKGEILLVRNQIGSSKNTNCDSSDEETESTLDMMTYDVPPEIAVTARAGDIVNPRDVISKQVRMSNFCYPKDRMAAFDLPVIYEDNHIAIVNKPPGVPVFSHRKGGHGNMTVRAALPFVLTEPREGTLRGLRRPHPVHRIDRPTSGLLICAKTQPSLVALTDQFKNREIEKLYTAILNGIPKHYREYKDNLKQSGQISLPNDSTWHEIDYNIEEKSAITLWRANKIAYSSKANSHCITQIDAKPKTGRRHQIRRHMAWVLECPLIGDKQYGGGNASAKYFRDLEKGLFLCARYVKFKHPYFNSKVGREEWLKKGDEYLKNSKCLQVEKSDPSDGGFVVFVQANIELPGKYEELFT